MSLFSLSVGMTTEGRLETLDIVRHLSTCGSAQTNNSPRVATFNKGYVVKDRSLWRECDHSQFVVFKAVINPNKRSIPIECFRQGQRYAVICTIYRILGWIELDSHALV
jgi:hypothetical protein